MLALGRVKENHSGRFLFEKPVRWVRFIQKSNQGHRGEKRQAADSRTWSLVALSELPASVAASLEDGSWEFKGAHLPNATPGKEALQ